MAGPLDLSPPGVSLDTSDTPNQVSLDTGTGSATVPQEVAASRATKAAYGLQGTAAEQPANNIQTGITNGQEDNIRADSAAKLRQDWNNKRAALISQALAQKNGPLDDNDMKWIDGTSSYKTYTFDPNSLFETNYANTYVNELDNFAQKLGSDNEWNIAKQVIPNDVEAAKRFGSITSAQSEVMLTAMQNLQAQYEKQSTFGAGVDFMKMAFPLFNPYTEAKSRGVVPGVGLTTGVDLGSNLEAQRQKLVDMPFPQFVDFIQNRIVGQMGKDNPQLAMYWLSQMMGQTSGDRVLNALNTFGLATDVGGLAIGAAQAGRLAMMVRGAVKDVVRSGTVAPDMAAKDVLSAVGDTKGAAVEAATNNIVKKMAGNANPTKDAIDAIGKFFSVDRANIKADAGTLSDTLTNILTQDSSAIQSQLVSKLGTTTRPFRVPIENLTKEQVQQIAETVSYRYPGLNNSMLRTFDPIWDPYSNTWSVTTAYGKRGGELFGSINELKNFLNKTGVTDAEVEHQGLGHYFTITRSLDEEDPLISKILIDNARPESLSKDSWVNNIPFMSYIRTADDTFSFEHSANRKAAVYPQAVMSAIAHEMGKHISDVARGLVRVDEAGNDVPVYKRYIPGVSRVMKRKEWKQLQQTLEYAQTAEDPTDTAKIKAKGWYFESPKQLQDFYLRNFQRTPSFTEQRAYFAVKNLTEYDRILRQVGMYRNMSRLGGETIKVVSTDKAGNLIKSNEFVGIPRKKIPGGTGNIMVMGDRIHSLEELETIDKADAAKASGKTRNAAKTSSSIKNQWQDQVDKGQKKLYEIYDPETRPLNGFVDEGDKHVRYVLADSIESRALDWNQVPRVGGGHHDYNYSHYVKQAIIHTEKVSGINQYSYEGDRTAFAVTHRALGEDVVKQMNVVRQLLDKGDEVGAEAAGRSLPWAWSDFRKHFNPTFDENGVKHPPMFNTSEDFKVVPKNLSISELDTDLRKRYGLNFRDRTRSDSLARAYQIAYTGQRDARDMFAVSAAGTRANPVFDLQNAELVSPMKTMNRALNSIVRSTFMDDYKMYAVKTWLAEAQKDMTEDPSIIKAMPYYVFKNINENSFVRGMDPARKQLLMANRYKINQLVGQPTVLTGFLHSVAQNLADVTYKNLGPNHTVITPDWLLAKLEDPFALMRSLTFNAYLGLFSIPQMLVQSMTYVNMFGITPRYATIGSLGAFLHGISRINRNDKILNYLDELATKFRFPGLPAWRLGEFKEAMTEMDKMAFSTVAGEYGPLNQTKNIIQSGADRILGWGQSPFRAGERSTRIGAWYIAFKEYRDANPTGPITNWERQKIAQRADLLYGNMSSASNAALDHGLLSLPMQFYAFTRRQAELLLGTRLGANPTERNLARMRVFAANAAMFGLPMAAGTFGFPLADYLRETAMDEGYVPGKDWMFGKTLDHLLMEGLPATGVYMATGNSYNIGPRYGTQGLTQFRDIFSDAGIWSVLGGASGALTVNTWHNKDGLVDAMMGLMPGSNKEYPLTVDDIVDVAKEFWAVKAGYGLAVAFNAGIWVNKNKQYIRDTTALEATLMTMFGVTPTEQADQFHMGSNLKNQQDMQKYALKRVGEEVAKAYVAMRSNDYETAKTYLTKAKAIQEGAKLNVEQMAGQISRALNQAGEELPDRIAWERLVKQAPADKIPMFRDMYGFIHDRLQQRKGQTQ